MKLNSTTFSFAKGDTEYDTLEHIATSMATDARCTNVYLVSMHKQAANDTISCTFKIADLAPGMNGLVQDNSSDQQGQQASVSPDDAQKVKSDAVTSYIQQNNVPINNKNDIDNVVDAVNQTQLTSDQLANNSQNQDPTLVQKITNALQNQNPVQ